MIKRQLILIGVKDDHQFEKIKIVLSAIAGVKRVSTEEPAKIIPEAEQREMPRIEHAAVMIINIMYPSIIVNC